MENPNERTPLNRPVEAIKFLKRFTTDEFQMLTSPDFNDALQTALVALNKQIAKRPIVCGSVGRSNLIIHKCPVCGSDDLIRDYPCKCGQKIYWR